MKSFLLSALAATATATDLLVPLYQYPLNNGAAWSPIEQALAANPSLTAKLVINPHDGPGGPGEGLNDPQYVAGTKALGGHANAQLLGYVHTSTEGGTTRCNMPWANITRDIRTWSAWVDAGIPIQGIFVDEAPTATTNDCVAYMTNLTALIRTDPGLHFARARPASSPAPLVVFNPGGTGALQPYYALQPDLVLALETCFVALDRAGQGADGCFPDPRFPYERYDHDGVGSSVDGVLFPSVGRGNAARTAVLVHGFHDYNGPSANLSASVDTLGRLIRGVVQRGIGATLFNTAWYSSFTDGPASIGQVASLLSAANGA